MNIYLDNAATTKPLDSVIEIANEIMKENYGNPSSLHIMGINAEKVIRDAKKTIANKLNVNEKEVFFTSGATESNNTAIFGTVYANKRKGNHIITTEIEHPSVLECFSKLEKEGHRVTYLSVNKEGIIDLEELKSVLSDDTIFVSIMAVNNELGSIQPINEVAKLKNKYNFILHTDAVQAFKKIPENLYNCADLISISGHKIHALKGVGALIVKQGIKVNPLICGGGQQNNFRSGTENVIGIGALLKAVLENNDTGKLMELKNRLKNGIESEKVKINCYNNGNSAPHILSVTFVGKRGEVILHSLEAEGIYVSTGSACHSNKFGESHVLKAIGMPKDEIGATIRFSFGEFNTIEEIDKTIEVIKSMKY
jgi:cysteine desulfurase